MPLIPNEIVERKSDGERGADVGSYSIYIGMSKGCAFVDLDFSYNMAIWYSMYACGGGVRCGWGEGRYMTARLIGMM